MARDLFERENPENVHGTDWKRVAAMLSPIGVAVGIGIAYFVSQGGCNGPKKNSYEVRPSESIGYRL